VVDLRNTAVTVVGAARSGVAVAKLLRANGAAVFVSDQSSADQLAKAAEELHAAGIPLETGGHSDRVYQCSLMVISPGVPSDAPVVRNAHSRNIRVVSEVEVGSWFCKAPIVAITGSNGKTTTTTLIGRVLGDAAKKHVVAGNIGTAFSGVVLGLDETAVAVLEVSSFQLDHIERFRPSIAVLMNITEDHMDRYGHSMEKYASSKARVFMNQTPSDRFIYDLDDEWTMKVVARSASQRIGFSVRTEPAEGAFVRNGVLTVRLGGATTEVIPVTEIGIPGTHNLYNAMAATLTGMLLGVEAASIRTTLRTFGGVEHRLEFVREVDGVRYVNDSKATNVDSVWYALQSFAAPIVLLLGGRDKGNDYERLAGLVRKHVRAIVAIGESADKVERSFSGVAPIARASSMDEAVVKAKGLAKPGDVVLLSPACASFDWFKNYEQRGMVFKELVKNL
jgi:UDP-N-acetylmuramoylalanine--D-glutamate ligase